MYRPNVFGFLQSRLLDREVLIIFGARAFRIVAGKEFRTGTERLLRRDLRSRDSRSIFGELDYWQNKSRRRKSLRAIAARRSAQSNS